MSDQEFEHDEWDPGTEVVGKYNFFGSSSHDLPFKKGDTLVLIKMTRDPNWYKARRNDGREGIVPYNYLQDKREVAEQSLPFAAVTRHHGTAELSSMPWFLGDISREEVEKLLRPLADGQFLIRESRSFKGDFALCVSCNNEVEYYRIRKNSRNFVTLDEECYFSSIIMLVQHYQVHQDGLCCSLEYPIDRAITQRVLEERGLAIQREHLDMQHLIGKGHLGEMWLGEYQGRKVAIRKLKEFKDDEVVKQLLTEAPIIATLQHPNLVCFIGVSLDCHPICIITEYVSQGSLVNYLRSRGKAVISRKNQLDFAKDICGGMVYLESKKCVHRDLAARNVLVSDDNSAKVGDPGLTRDALSIKSERIKLQLKWTAPEALRENKFSCESDVWSFGILLWEIYTYGRVPYYRVTVDTVVSLVQQGHRLASPDGCPDQIYQVMQACWAEDPCRRPHFDQILSFLYTIAVIEY